MARADRRLATNVPGPLFVDASCIDCGTCWSLAPSSFEDHASGQARVAHQPGSPDERARAFMALVSCPTSSIGTEEADVAAEVQAAARALPEPVADGVRFCGYASPRSYGAASWLLSRGPRGNVLVDSPRAAAPLLQRIGALGGVDRLVLTHRDDVADHARLRERLGCERIIHADDVGPDTAGVERRIEGREPVPLDDDLLLVPVPGHTPGSMALLWRETFLFSGDHVWGEGDGLGASREVCWWSWEEQTRSMERLLDLRFEWVLPGHGARFHAGSPDAMRREVEALVKRMRRAA